MILQHVELSGRTEAWMITSLPTLLLGTLGLTPQPLEQPSMQLPSKLHLQKGYT